MKQLTEEQKETVQETAKQLTEKFVEANKSILFDIKKVTTKGESIREELVGLEDENRETKRLVEEQFMNDVCIVKEFLGDYADALEICNDERCGYFQYKIGVNDDNQVWVVYRYGREDFIEYDNYVEIDGRKYQRYVQDDIEVYSDGYDTESYGSFEKMFNDSDVVTQFETALQDYIAYHTPKEKPLTE